MLTFAERVAEQAAGLKEATGLGATLCAGSDRYPYSVVKVEKSKSGKTTTWTVQEDVAVRKDDRGYFTESQDYAYFANPNGPTRTFKRTEGRKHKDSFFIGKRDRHNDPHF